jgi:hypothetical protein
MYVPKLKSHILKIMSLKIPCLGFGEPPECKQTPGGQKLRQLRTPQGTGSDWKNLPGTAQTDRHCCFNMKLIKMDTQS